MSIIFNGKSYNSVEEMPANERQAYEAMFQIFTDKNGNGIPDFLEGDIAKNVTTAFTNVVHYDGKVYNSLDELPPEAREKVKAAFVKLNNLGLIAETPKQPVFESAIRPSKPLISPEPPIEESKGGNWLVILSFLGAVLLCAVVVAMVLFAR